MTPDLGSYQWRGARALVLLHEQHMRELLVTWRAFVASGKPLPATEDPDYATPQKLLRHVFRASRGYMTWLCEHLGYPDPGIQEPPDEQQIEAQAAAFMEHLLERWRLPLEGLLEKRSEEEYKSRWGTTYSIDGMLEHAVMHPIRHSFQLKELMSRK